MTQIGEAIGVALASQLEAQKCPFQEPAPPATDEDAENPADDDTEAAEGPQKSNGGVLGDNLVAGSEGKEGTTNDKYAYASFGEIRKEPRLDTARTGAKVRVTGDPAAYPYTLAAHHLIPGNASLKKSPLYDYMVNGRKVKTEKKTYTIEANIGYNVNGAHNGVWLPGNYAIRVANPDNHKKKTWSALVNDPSEYPWCYRYMAAVVKKTGGQFHDTHSQYNENVESLLNKICTALIKHQDNCPDCADKDKVPPPYMLKMRLYLQSDFLKGRVTGTPSEWQRYFTSDRFREELTAKRKEFLAAFHDAQPEV